MKKYIGFILTGAIVLSLFGGNVAQAAALTQAQVNAIIGLLQAFGASASTIAEVEADLTGKSITTTPIINNPITTPTTNTNTFVASNLNGWSPIYVSWNSLSGYGDWQNSNSILSQDQLGALHYKIENSGFGNLGSDYAVTARVQFLAGQNEAGICARMDSQGNGYCFSTSWGGTSGTMISKFHGGDQNPQNLNGGNSVNLQDNVWYDLKLQVSGNTISGKIWQDGTNEPFVWTAQASDNDFMSAGNIGFYSYNSSVKISSVNVSANTTTTVTTPTSAPTITSVSPNSISDNLTTSPTLTIYGTNLSGANKVNLSCADNSGCGGTDGITPTFNSNTEVQFVADVRLFSGASAYNLSISTPTGTSNTLPFTITPVTQTPTSTPVSASPLLIAKNGNFTDQTIIANTSYQKIGSFILQNHSATTNIQLSNITVGIGGTIPLTSLANLRISLVNNPVNPSTSNNFSVNNVIVANASLEVDIFADVGAITTNGTSTITTTLTVTAAGATISGNGASGQTIFVVSSVISVGPISVSSNLVSGSPVPQYVIGGSTSPIAIYNVANSVGSSVVTEMDFQTEDNGVIVSVTAGGVTTPVVAGKAILTGLNILVPSGLAGVNIPVSVTYNKVGTGGLSIDGLSSGLELDTVKSPANTVSTIISSEPMFLVASKPTITVSSPSNLLSAQPELIDVTVSANSSGDISVDQLPIMVTTSGPGSFLGLGLSIPSQSVVVKDQSGNTLAIVNGTLSVPANGTGKVNLTFTGGYRILAGSSQTFKIFAKVSGFTGMAQSVQTGLNSSYLFKWTDVNGGSSEGALDGSHIVNYPTNAVTVQSAN